VPVSAKRNNVRIDDEPHNAARPAFPAGLINSHDEITERQGSLVIGFHDPLVLGSAVVIVWASASNQCCTSHP
jgi:hypothetical protein